MYEKTEYKGIKIINMPIIEVLGMTGIGTFYQCFIATVLATFSDAEIIHYHAQGPALFSFIPKFFAPKKKIGFTCHGIDWQRDKWSCKLTLNLRINDTNYEIFCQDF